MKFLQNNPELATVFVLAIILATAMWWNLDTIKDVRAEMYDKYKVEKAARAAAESSEGKQHETFNTK